MALRKTGLAALFAMVGALAFVAPAGAQPQPGAERTVAYNVPAGSLTRALQAFMRHTGGEVSFQADALDGRETSGVNGQFPPAEALGRLLAGTGLTFLQDSSGAYFLFPVARVRVPGGRCVRDRVQPSICREQ